MSVTPCRLSDPLLDHPRALVERVAEALGGTAVARTGLMGFVSSDHDRFLNQLTAGAETSADEIAAALDGRPGFVWLADDRLATTSMLGMTAMTVSSPPTPRAVGDIAEVRTAADVADWHEIYCEVFGCDPRAVDDWRRIADALRDSLVLLLARVDGMPAATGGVFVAGAWAGLYCFTTRYGMRGRGLCTALVRVAHAVARERGVERALLHATAVGAPVYAGAGYEPERSLPLLVA